MEGGLKRLGRSVSGAFHFSPKPLTPYNKLKCLGLLKKEAGVLIFSTNGIFRSETPTVFHQLDQWNRVKSPVGTISYHGFGVFRGLRDTAGSENPESDVGFEKNIKHENEDKDVSGNKIKIVNDLTENLSLAHLRHLRGHERIMRRVRRKRRARDKGHEPGDDREAMG